MKVVFLAASLFGGGVERTISYLSDFFSKSGVDTTILSIGDIKFYDVSENVKFKSLNIPNTVKQDSLFKRIYLYGKRRALVDLYMLKNKPDLVICIAPQVTRYVVNLQKLGLLRIMTSERNNPEYDTKQERKIKEKAFRVCSGIVFQTERAKKCFPDIIASKSKVIPNAVGNEYVFKARVPDIPQKKFSAIGRLTKQKDYKTMILAFGIIHKKYPDYRLEIYGMGEDKASLQQLVEDNNLQTYVLFKDTAKDAIVQIADSTAFLLSSIYEGMPNVLMEALGTGLPCISTDCPFGPRELITNNVNGILVPVGDHEAMADAMERFIQSPAFAKQCGESGKKILETNSVERIGMQYLSFAKSICDNE